MILLASTSDKLQVVTSTAGAVDVHASWMDNAAGTITPGRTNSVITTQTTTDVVAAPAASVIRNVKTVHVCNRGSAGLDITIQHTDGTTVVQLHKQTLGAGATLQYIDEVGAFVSPTLPTPAITSGNRVLLNRQDFLSAAAASADFFADFSAYDWLEIRLHDLLLSAEAQMLMRMSFDGSTFDASSSNHVSSGSSALGTNTGAATGGTSAGFLVGYIVPAAANATYPCMAEGRLRLGTLSGATPAYFGMSAGRYSAAEFGSTHFGAYFGAFTANPVRGLRFVPASGTISRGTFQIFGIVK